MGYVKATMEKQTTMEKQATKPPWKETTPQGGEEEDKDKVGGNVMTDIGGDPSALLEGGCCIIH